jgi:hypothetical protein
MHLINLNTFSYREIVLKRDNDFAKNVRILRMSSAATTCLAECTAHAESIKFSYLPCRYTDANSVRDGIIIYFVLENINKK